MALKERDYTNMRETERVRDAVKINHTEVKDYSLKNMVGVAWRWSQMAEHDHVASVWIGADNFVGQGTEISRGVHVLVERQDEHDWLPRAIVRVPSFNNRTPDMLIDTREVNEECLRDHVARVTIGNSTSIIDLEELLKATRYA